MPNILESINLKKLVTEMHAPNGVGIKNRRLWLRTYPKVFVGCEAVTWFKSQYNLSTEQAIHLGNLLIQNKLIHHVLDRHNFKNEYLFYRFYWDEV